jgi:lipoate---protein ligase
MKIRFIDAGTVSGLRSQSIYHGLGYAQTPHTPDTIVLATPGTPYMCIGFFQDVENELDINYCRTNQLPVIRRETGGGAVYIDKGQLFVQWIFQQSSLPRRVDQRFQLFVEPLIETYKFFGINAYYHPINDVHVGGKKIVGTGAGTIGEGEVVTGNFLFDFDYDIMIDAINAPTPGFREAVRRNMKQYLTTMNQELGEAPQRDEVIKVYRQKCADTLGVKIDTGGFTDEELLAMEKVERKFLDEGWLYQTKRLPGKNKLFKIHLGVWIGRVSFELDKGTMNTVLTMKDNVITEISLSTDGLQNNFSLADIESELLGTPMDQDLIYEKVKKTATDNLAKDWTKCIYQVKELQLQQTGNGELARSN